MLMFPVVPSAPAAPHQRSQCAPVSAPLSSKVIGSISRPNQRLRLLPGAPARPRIGRAARPSTSPRARRVGGAGFEARGEGRRVRRRCEVSTVCPHSPQKWPVCVCLRTTRDVPSSRVRSQRCDAPRADASPLSSSPLWHRCGSGAGEQFRA